MEQLGKRVETNCNAAIAENEDPSRTGDAIRRLVELTGGMDWLEPGHKPR
jgi:hypothetical protein